MALNRGEQCATQSARAGKHNTVARLCQASWATMKAVVCPLGEQEALKGLWLPRALQSLPEA